MNWSEYPASSATFSALPGRRGPPGLLPRVHLPGPIFGWGRLSKGIHLATISARRYRHTMPPPPGSSQPTHGCSTPWVPASTLRRAAPSSMVSAASAHHFWRLPVRVLPRHHSPRGWSPVPLWLASPSGRWSVRPARAVTRGRGSGTRRGVPSPASAWIVVLIGGLRTALSATSRARRWLRCNL